MLKYNLVTAFRSIRRNLSFSLINISGFSLGLTLVIILFTWLQFEFSFDKFHENSDRIYRVVVEFQSGTIPDNFGGTPFQLGEVLKNDIPEISDYVRFGSLGRTIVKYGKTQFWEEIELADPSIFKIFSFKLLSGDPHTALKNPGSIVVSETKSRKYFGTANPLGQTLLLGNEKRPYIITGIMKDIPANSQLQFDFLGSFSEIKNNISWYHWNYSTYILAQNSGTFITVSQKLPEIVKKIPGDEKFQLHIQPLKSIHLNSRLRGDLPTNTDVNTIFIISSILLLVLLVACINYMNMATARYTSRGKEAGLRKVAGASNSNLTLQFLCESFAITFSSLIFAVFLSYLIMPFFIIVTGIPLELKSLLNFNSIVEFIILIIITSFLSGIYPAFTLSSVNPVSALRYDFKLVKTISIKSLRKGLVVFQFFVSIVLIACTLIIHSQLAFIRHKSLGLNTDQVVVVPIYQVEVKPKYELFKKEILSNPYILSASAAAYSPGNQYYNNNAWWEGIQENDYSNRMSWLPVDPDFINTLKIQLVKGENLPEHISSDSPRAYILNETAVKMLGWDEPIGKKFEIHGIGKGSITGIVKDFNYKSLHSDVEPMALTTFSEIFDNLMIKISGDNIPGTIGFLSKTWEKLFPVTLFEYSYLNDDFQKMYAKETMTLKMITAVSILSLFISCIGLFGLAIFTTDRRIKEIGLRKVAGSTSCGIILLLNFEFIRWILAALFIACPVTIYLMNKWLASFAYRINLSWWIFASAGIISILISLFTVSWHTWYIATRNPAECLRHD